MKNLYSNHPGLYLQLMKSTMHSKVAVQDTSSDLATSQPLTIRGNHKSVLLVHHHTVKWVRTWQERPGTGFNAELHWSSFFFFLEKFKSF